MDCHSEGRAEVETADSLILKYKPSDSDAWIDLLTSLVPDTDTISDS